MANPVLFVLFYFEREKQNKVSLPRVIRMKASRKNHWNRREHGEILEQLLVPVGIWWLGGVGD